MSSSESITLPDDRCEAAVGFVPKWIEEVDCRNGDLQSLAHCFSRQ